MVPEGWKISTLGDVCGNNLQTGPFGSQLHANEYEADGVPVLMPKDLNGFRADTSSAAKISVERARDLSKHRLSKGDILFSRRGDVTRFALIDETSAGSLCGTGCLKATPGEQHSPEFLSYFLQKHWVRKWLEQNAVGQTMPNMNTAILSELPLMVAGSRQEEDTIAQILSTWDQAITATERLLENSQQRKKGLMQQLLTGKKRLPGFEGEWESSTLTKHCSVATGNKDLQNKVEDGEYPFFVRSSNIERIDSYSFDGEAILIPGDGRVGEIFHYIKGKFDYHQRVYKLSDFKGALGLFIYYYLKRFFKAEVIKNSVKATVDSLRMPVFTGMRIKLPSLKEQQSIVDVLSCSDREIKEISRRLDLLKQEKKALMQQLLTGKRRVQVDTEAA